MCSERESVWTVLELRTAVIERGAREARDRAKEAEHSSPERAHDIERAYNRGDR